MCANQNDGNRGVRKGQRRWKVWGWAAVMLFTAVFSCETPAAAEDRVADFPWQLSDRRTTASESPSRGGGGDGDILVFDIVDSATESKNRSDDGEIVVGMDGELYLVTTWEYESVQFVVGLRYSF